jgi:hypothetical protein
MFWFTALRLKSIAWFVQALSYQNLPPDYLLQLMQRLLTLSARSLPSHASTQLLPAPRLLEPVSGPHSILPSMRQPVLRSRLNAKDALNPCTSLTLSALPSLVSLPLL